MLSRPFPTRVLAVFALLVLCAAPLDAQDPRPIGFEAFEIWNEIGTRAISDDGAWVYFTLTKEDGDDELVVRHTTDATEYRIERGASPTFAHGSSRVVYRVRPHVEAVREAEADRNGETPRDSLGILDLTTGERSHEPLLQNFSVRDRYLAIHLRPEADTVPGEGEETKEDGTLRVRDLETGETDEHWYVTGYSWADEEPRLLVATAPPEDAPVVAGLFVVDAPSGEMTTVMEGPGAFSQLTFDDAGEQVAFLHEEDETHTLYRWNGDLTPVTSSAGEGLRDGWELSEFSSVSFSDDGSRLFFGTIPSPEPVAEDRPRLETEVDVEVWHWEDDELMTVQNVRQNQERRRNYTAVLLDDRIVQLADEALPSVNVSSGGDGRWATATTTLPYAIEASWESPNYRDAWLVEVETGERTLLAERIRANPSLSPDETFLTWYEPGDSTWYVRDVEGGEVRELSAGIPHPVWNEMHDSPSPAGSYGGAGWMDGEDRILLHDRYDVWAVDPRNPESATSVTGGAGREAGIRYRLVNLDSDDWESGQSVLASAFDTRTKDAGFARLTLGAGGAPSTIVMEPRNFSNPMKAEDADRILFTQESFREFPDLWVATPDFEGRTRMSEANPQQAEYRWGDAELMSWTSLDGIELDGILIKPDDFDPNREYPLMVYFYDRSSDGLHSHQAPVPHRSVINRPMYASHDYVVFVPDIVYRLGYPGESAYNAIMPGVTKLIEEGFIDRERIALQGHSWGGYQIAFMVTRTQGLFRAAAAGAPVSNMTSAYGGIRWDSGLVRQFQYERTQSRLGATLWEAPMRYIENSPLFWADKIETPLLIMHNDEDGAVPWEQGIELFVALRRLAKPAWMINYTGEPHWPTTFANKRDWNIRMFHFFDHFLKDAPPPVWMVEGIPALRKGETLGYELVEGATIVDH
jgi:dipeptidyl aminopeptidase/acylaminoacyl peptidase